MKTKKWRIFGFLCITMSGVKIVQSSAEAPSYLLRNIDTGEQKLPNAFERTALKLSREVESDTHTIGNSEELKIAPQRLQLFDLPPEIVVSILDYLNGESLGATAKTCKWLRETTQNIGLYNFLHAAYNNKFEVVKSIVKSSVPAGCKISIDGSADKFGGKTAMMCAALGGNVNIVRYLLECNAVVAKEDEKRNNVLWYAAYSGNQELFNIFVGREDFSRRWDLCIHDLLLKSASVGNREIVHFLIIHKEAYSLDVNKENCDGATALYFAAQNGHETVVDLLLKNKNVDVNKAEKNGATPLFIATQKGYENIVTLLVYHKDIDVLKSRPNGDTPLNIAYHRGNQAIINILEEKLRVNNQDLSEAARSNFLL